ncbi:ground-like domain protein [Necator americanus]|uniref:Ground-like domain protein n=1 Tax=Necator americanus TaxID=51031 RepID=W2TYG6_NECAM|nr:ground-like domain protein [Necator americanus]ETN87115.1 ground-like domain protein [Necator americanus]
MLLIAGLMLLFTGTHAIFFGGGGGGGGGCCCGCGTPQPASCGCQPAAQCPPPAPCPVCVQQSCPPPPTAYCPQVQPVYVPCSGGGCGGGGYATGPASGGGGYATAPAVGSYALGNFAAPPLPAANSYLAGPSLAAPVPAPSVASYATGGGYGGEYLPQSDEPNAEASLPASSSSSSSTSSNYAPPLNAKLRSPELHACEPARIKYIILKSKKARDAGNEEVMEEAEEVDHPAPVEATASPLEAREIADDISRNVAAENEEEETRADGTPTFSDAKCNSKQLQQLILDNIVREDALASKRAIHESSLKRFPEATVDVICSGTGFTYLVSTTEHCEAQKDSVICFVYKRPLLRH